MLHPESGTATTPQRRGQLLHVRIAVRVADPRTAPSSPFAAPGGAAATTSCTAHHRARRSCSYPASSCRITPRTPPPTAHQAQPRPGTATKAGPHPAPQTAWSTPVILVTPHTLPSGRASNSSHSCSSRVGAPPSSNSTLWVCRPPPARCRRPTPTRAAAPLHTAPQPPSNPLRPGAAAQAAAALAAATACGRVVHPRVGRAAVLQPAGGGAAGRPSPLQPTCR